jgi:hypothetical protein
MRRPTLALVLLALVPAGGFGQASYSDFDDLPVPPQPELCPECFCAAVNYFLQEMPSLSSKVKETPESLPPPSDPWDNLRFLRQGQQIRIFDANSRKVSARFLGLSGRALEFEANGKAMTLARQDVAMVSLRPPSKAERMLLSVLGGALVGMSVWAEADGQARRCWDEDGYCCEEEHGLSSRSAAISTAVSAAASGLAVALVKEDELVIYYHGWGSPDYQASPDRDLPREEERAAEGENSSAPASGDDGDQASQVIPDLN